MPLTIFSRRGRVVVYGPQDHDKHFSTWKLFHFRSIFSGWLIKHHSLYSFFLWTFFWLSPQHSATLWSLLLFAKCRRFILQQNVCSAAWLWLIFVLALLFSRFLLPFLWKSQVANGVLFTWLSVLLTSPSADFLSQQPLPLAWTGFSRCFWDWDTCLLYTSDAADE